MIKLLGIPTDINSSFLKGSALAPARIRAVGMDGAGNTFCERGKEIAAGQAYEDLGDLNLQTLDAGNAYQAIKAGVQDVLTPGDRFLFLGGDHSVSYPLIEACTAAYPQLHILHLDAHADLYDNFEDNPYSHASPFARLMERNIPASLTQVGIRTLNTHQYEQAKRFNCTVIEMRNFNFDFIAALKGPLYLSLDLDVLDPAFAPGLSHHEPGGLSVRDIIRIIQSIQVPLVGADIVELNPKRDVNDMTARVVYKLMKELISKMHDDANPK